MKYWWNVNDSGWMIYKEKRLSHCYFIHHKSQKECPGIEDAFLSSKDEE